MSTFSNKLLLTILLLVICANTSILLSTKNYTLLDNLKSFFTQYHKEESVQYKLTLSTQDTRKLRSWELFDDSEKLNKARLEGEMCSGKKCTKVKVRSKGDLSRHWESKRKSYRFKFDDHSFMQADIVDFTLAKDRYFEIEYLAKSLGDKLGLMQLPYEMSLMSINNSHKTLYLKSLKYTKINMEKYLREYTHIVRLKNLWLPNLKQANIGTFYYGFNENIYYFNKWREYEQLYTIEPERNIEDVTYQLSQGLKCIRDACPQLQAHFHLESFAKWLAVISIFGSYHATLGDNLFFLYNKAQRNFSPIVNDVVIRPIKSNFDIWLINMQRGNGFINSLFQIKAFEYLFKKKLKELMDLDILKLRNQILKKYSQFYEYSNTSPFLIKRGIEGRGHVLSNNLKKIEEYLQ